MLVLFYRILNVNFKKIVLAHLSVYVLKGILFLYSSLVYIEYLCKGKMNFKGVSNSAIFLENYF